VLRKVLEVERKNILKVKDPLSKSIRDLAQKHSLIELDQENDPFCHRLISAFVRKTIDRNKNTKLHNRIVRTILDEMERTTDDADTVSLRELEKVVPHADHMLTSRTFDLKPGQAVDLANHIGWHHSRWGRYRVSENYRRKALKRAEADFKPGDPKIASCYSNRGEVLYFLGQYKKAIESFEKALSSDVKTYGKEYPDVARDWDNLGVTYKALGQYEKASEYYEKALKILRLTLGDDHTHTKLVKKNLEIASKK
jgi:tetratricopeptide (TPR) repeat protein